MTRLVACFLFPVFCLLLAAGAASAQSPLVTAIAVEQEGIPLTEPVITALIESPVGKPVDMREVRESITHLMSLNRYEDVQVYQEAAGNGLRLKFVLVPLHPLDRIEYRGALGVSEGDLRQSISERFGTAAVPARQDELQRHLAQYYRDRGYVRVQVGSRIEQTHRPDRASLVFEIAAGPRSSIAAVDVEGVTAAERATLLAETGVRAGQPYDSAVIQRALDAYQADLRARGYYEARAAHSATFDPAGGARVIFSLDRGPLVTISFSGDVVPDGERETLVPIQAEASVDEDLLEDSSRAIENYFKARGYRDALVDYTRNEQDGALIITFAVTRGTRYVTGEVTVTGNTAVATAEILQAIRLEADAPFVEETVDSGVGAIRTIYRSRGFTRADVRAVPATLPDADASADRRLEVSVTINEGPRTRVGAVAIAGNTVLTEAELRGMIVTAPGRPFNELEIAADRDRIDLEYRNRGYDSIVVQPQVVLADGDTRADVSLAISEGPQIFVDQVIILGNRRTSLDTIARELTLRPGEPLGYSAMLESQQRLSALGLFRRIQITALVHPGEPRRDILVQLEEAPPTTLGYGGGLEGTVRVRSDEQGLAEERFELAPRGFFEVTRRNLFGKNRSVSLFGRVSLKSRNVVFADNGLRLTEPDGRYGFNEYRVYSTYREPRIFNSRAEFLVTGILDQAIRSSFNFRTREARAELGLRVSPIYSFAGRYSFEHTTLFDEQYDESEKPLIDKLFPQVRLSKVAASLVRDSRDDVIYPNRGTFTVIDGEVAGRAMGSEVGFVKTFVQTFAYVSLPTRRRTILAMAARVGAARGFELKGQEGSEEGVQLPASERFFAGGDSTVRGFSLDRLGDERTITGSGFPTGGNAEAVFQAELRVSILGTRAELVGFMDAGNIFRLASDFDLTNLRPAAGFGGRYRSPVGPIRVDLGFNLDRKELVPGTLERGYVLHISLGQAF